MRGNYTHLIIFLQRQICFPHVQVSLYAPLITLMERNERLWECITNLHNGDVMLFALITQAQWERNAQSEFKRHTFSPKKLCVCYSDMIAEDHLLYTAYFSFKTKRQPFSMRRNSTLFIFVTTSFVTMFSQSQSLTASLFFPYLKRNVLLLMTMTLRETKRFFIHSNWRKKEALLRFLLRNKHIVTFL